MQINNIVFVHGWGLNSGIWADFAMRFTHVEPAIKVHLIDIAGYGSQVDKASSADLIELAVDCLSRAPEQALWVGWSLGGMLALKAALFEAGSKRPRIQALQLLNTTPRFVVADDWPSGVQLQSFQRFCDAFSADYDNTLSKFLAMQAGRNQVAQKLAAKAHTSICAQAAPSPKTLQLGIDCLGRHNMLGEIKPLAIPTQVVCGSLDRVAHPKVAKVLSDLLQSELITFDTGHAPFLTDPEQSLSNLLSFIRRVKA